MNKEKKQILPQKRIGVIGGLGPRASVHFYQLVIDCCAKRFAAAQDSEYPSIVLFSISSFGLAETGLANQNILISDLHEAFNCFSKANVDIIAIACNSVYAYYNEIATQTKIQIVNLLDEVASFLSARPIKSVSILGSRGVVSSKIYDSFLDKKNIIAYYPDQSTQARIDAWIFDVMRGAYGSQTISDFQDVIKVQLQSNDAVLVACSELSVLVNPFLLSENVFDSMFILANCVLDLAMD